MNIHTTIGLYRDGSFKINGVHPDDLENHITYNKEYRFGRALFVDGKCVYNGCLSDVEVQDFEVKIKDSINLKAEEITRPYV